MDAEVVVLDGAGARTAIDSAEARATDAGRVLALLAGPTAAPPLYEAIRYALNRVQTDPEFRWHMLGTETLDRLIHAEALYTPDGAKRKCAASARQTASRSIGGASPSAPSTESASANWS